MKSPWVRLSIFGAFTLFITVLLGAVIGNYRPFAERYELEAAFGDATGLLKGDPVTLAGVTVGKVKETRVERGLALVRLSVDEQVRLPRSGRVVIRYRNLIGQRVVLLEPGEGRAPFYGPDDRVPVSRTEGPLDLGQVFNNLRPLLTTIDAEDVNTLSSALVESFSTHKTDIDAILADTARVTEELAARDEKVASLIANVDSVSTDLAGKRSALRTLLANLSKITGTLEANSGPLDQTLTGLDAAMGQLGKLIRDNRGSLDADIKDLAALLAIVANHESDLIQITRGLDDTLRATARGTTNGEWMNLYVFSLCSSTDPACRDTTPTLSNSSKNISAVIGYAIGDYP